MATQREAEQLSLFQARRHLGHSLELRLHRHHRHYLGSQPQQESQHASQVVDCRLHSLVRSPCRMQGYQTREFTQTCESFIDSTHKFNS